MLAIKKISMRQKNLKYESIPAFSSLIDFLFGLAFLTRFNCGSNNIRDAFSCDDLFDFQQTVQEETSLFFTYLYAY